MPIFGSKFSPKRAPSRKKNGNLSKDSINELVSDQNIVCLKLGEQQLLFEKGEWIPETGKNNVNYKSNRKLKKKVQELQEENNLLKIKFQMVLNMLTETTAESHIQQREIEKLKKIDRYKQKN